MTKTELLAKFEELRALEDDLKGRAFGILKELGVKFDYIESIESMTPEVTTVKYGVDEGSYDAFNIDTIPTDLMQVADDEIPAAVAMMKAAREAEQERQRKVEEDARRKREIAYYEESMVNLQKRLEELKALDK